MTTVESHPIVEKQTRPDPWKKVSELVDPRNPDPSAIQALLDRGTILHNTGFISWFEHASATIDKDPLDYAKAHANRKKAKDNEAAMNDDASYTRTIQSLNKLESDLLKEAQLDVADEIKDPQLRTSLSQMSVGTKLISRAVEATPEV